MPSWSWPPIERSCSADNQPASGADIELCVAGSAISSSGRSQSAACPLQRRAGAAGASTPPLPRNGADARRDQREGRRHSATNRARERPAAWHVRVLGS